MENKSKEEILNDYIAFRSLSNHTININDIKHHIEKFINHSKEDLNNFNENMLIAYINEINKNYKVTSANTIKASYLKPFIKWLYPEWSSRFRNLDRILKTVKAGDIYTDEDLLNENNFEKIIKTEESHFWKTFFLILFYGGCRPIEVCLLKWKDIEFIEDGAYINIYSKKNKKYFLKFVPSNVKFYLEELKKNSISEYVFLNNTSKKPITVKGAYFEIRKISQKALGKKTNLYTLRHSIATIIYNKDSLKDDDAARQMGHSKSMKNTYNHPHKDRLKELAKKVYMTSEDLPTEKKLELEAEIKKLKKNADEKDKIFEEFETRMLNKIAQIEEMYKNTKSKIPTTTTNN